MKVLNLYAGTGGNRRLWKNCEVTAVELDSKRSKMYYDEFPNDKVIVADAHQYLLNNHKEYDFIWSSPPCPTYSKTNYFTQHIRKEQVYPDMKLYQEIIFLDNWFKGKYVVENVIPYYNPLIPATKIGRHLFWSNFTITPISQPKDDIGTMVKGHPNRANLKSAEVRNEVNSELGLHIFNLAKGIVQSNNINQIGLFN